MNKITNIITHNVNQISMNTNTSKSITTTTNTSNNSSNSNCRPLNRPFTMNDTTIDHLVDPICFEINKSHQSNHFNYDNYSKQCQLYPQQSLQNKENNSGIANDTLTLNNIYIYQQSFTLSNALSATRLSFAISEDALSATRLSFAISEDELSKIIFSNWTNSCSILSFILMTVLVGSGLVSFCCLCALFAWFAGFLLPLILFKAGACFAQLLIPRVSNGNVLVCREMDRTAIDCCETLACDGGDNDIETNDNLNDFEMAGKSYIKCNEITKAVNCFIICENFNDVKPLINKITTPSLHMKYAKEMDLIKQYNDALNLYKIANDKLSNILLDNLIFVCILLCHY